jgi:hypothetical protein
MTSEDVTLLDPVIIALVLKYRQRKVEQDKTAIISSTRTTATCRSHQISSFREECNGCLPPHLLGWSPPISGELLQALDDEAEPILKQLASM